jgi:hypothetical protein
MESPVGVLLRGLMGEGAVVEDMIIFAWRTTEFVG